MFGARLAQLHTHIDKARRQAQPVAGDGLGVGVGDGAANRSDPGALDQQIAGRIAPCRRVDQPRAADQDTPRHDRSSSYRSLS